MNKMKKLILLGALLCATFTSVQAAQIATNVTAGGVHLLSTNRASIYSIELTGANPVTVSLYDMDTIAAPFFGTNYTNIAFTSRITYATNIASSFVGLNGYTNWVTNAGIFTLTNSSSIYTNALQPQGSFVVAGGTYAVYTTDALFSRGVCMLTTTNVSVVINYRNAQ